MHYGRSATASTRPFAWPTAERFSAVGAVVCGDGWRLLAGRRGQVVVLTAHVAGRSPTARHCGTGDVVETDQLLYEAVARKLCQRAARLVAAHRTDDRHVGRMLLHAHAQYNTHCRATERHLPYGITQCDLPPDTGERALL